VWVSAALGDDDHEGTQEESVKTLSRAIELAESSGLERVCACGGNDAEYAEWVVLRPGVSLLGGFDCQDGWRYRGFEKRAVIHPPGAPVPLALTASGKESLITDFVVVADDATEPGASVIAVLALPHSRARFRRAEVVAGNGADGADGEGGNHDGLAAPNGAVGNNGMDACVQDPGLGGLAIVAECGDGTQSISGQGGDGNQAAATAGLQGLPAPDPNPQGFGAGGKGQDATLGTKCIGGAHGAHGKDGEDGQGGKALGKLTEQGYFGVHGGDGQPGLPGQGGGGGGASLGLCVAAPYGGAGGGSGGAGGCGGRAGKGGQAGGSSFGIAVLSPDIFGEDIVFRTGNGGKGGDGGEGQLAGQGGLPGYGGLGIGVPGGAQNGCAGGVGGHGGRGGHGGGGKGGHAGCIARAGDNVFTAVGVVYIRGEFGAGGKGGDPASSVGDGDRGDSQDSITLDQ
jgi:hypothetical protein